MAAQQTELVDFYVTPFKGTDGVIRTWFVHRGNPRSTYVAVCDSRQEAVNRAIAMSKSQRVLGKTSVVYVREDSGAAWKILPD
jgi:hypothetical protein